jgi:predicted amidohydrolase
MEMNVITIALLQMTACGNDQTANMVKGEAFCRRAREMRADIALFPEMWSIGYSFDHPAQEGAPDPSGQPESSNDLWRAPEFWRPEERSYDAALRERVERWQAQAIDRESEFVRRYRDLARELEMAIALTYLERWDGPPRNSVSLIDRHGEIVLTYAKVHTCDFDLPEAACTPGDAFHVCTLDTVQGNVRIGAMICYDREFPESARILMLKGAELILTPNSCELEINRIAQFRTRACENMVGVAMTNYAAPQLNGHSIAFDGIAFDKNGSRDMLVVEAGESEGIYLARFDMDRLRDYRRRETWGNAFRKPDRYGPLTSLEVEEPFVRVNPQGEAYHRTRRGAGLEARRG